MPWLVSWMDKLYKYWIIPFIKPSVDIYKKNTFNIISFENLTDCSKFWYAKAKNIFEIFNFTFGKEVLLRRQCSAMELFILDRNLRFWHLNPGYSQWDQRKLLCFQYFYFLRLENTQFTVKLSAVFKLMVILSHVILRLLLYGVD